MEDPLIDDTAICPACDGSGSGVADTSCGFCGGGGGVPLSAAQDFENKRRIMTARPEFGDAIAVIQADRDAAWPFRPEGYGPLDKPSWDAGVYDGCRHIQAFARHRTSSALPLAHPAAPQGEDSKESARIVRWIDQAIERAKRHGNTEGVWLFASQWQVVRAALAPAAIASGREGAE